MERTFVMLKPDAVGRRLCGKIIGRLEAKGLRLVGLKMQIVPNALAEKHYAEHKGKPFYPALVKFITSGPSIQMVWEGESAVAVVRRMNGVTNGVEAGVGTIRGDFGLSGRYNLVHASDSVETAEREIGMYFDGAELWAYDMPDMHWFTN
ncbi:MAG: nucleoside-diphosphate kinase [Rhodopirellula sp.]|nr:nucleoside-diphosphate kinase [Rhodopirellula sp.]